MRPLRKALQRPRVRLGPDRKPSQRKLPSRRRSCSRRKSCRSIGKAAAIGYYPRGCLRGGVELPSTGATWQVMRLSRNRNWGHPALIKFLERFAPLAAKATGWHGVLVGDMAQPRGGPLPFGHSSHQIGLDVDVWFMPMPDRVLSKDERDNMPFLNLVAGDRKHINSSVWTPAHAAFIRTAAEQPEVERVLVNAAIKKELCTMQGDKHPAWMSKVRPWYGHDDHIHVRLRCPADSPTCRKQDPPRDGPGCSARISSPGLRTRCCIPNRPRPAPNRQNRRIRSRSPTCRRSAKTCSRRPHASWCRARRTSRTGFSSPFRSLRSPC